MNISSNSSSSGGSGIILFSSTGDDGDSGDSWTALILSVTLTALYALLSVVSVVQLIRIIWNRHSALSFQFLFLFLVALHSVARVVFFIDLSYVPTIIILYLFWLPSDLQFAIFSLFILFYSSLLPTWSSTKRVYINLWLTINGGTMILTVLYITLPCLSNCNVTPSMEMYHHAYILGQTIVLLIIYAYHGYILHCTSQSSHYHLLLGIHHPPFPLWLLTVFFLSVFIGHSVISTLGALNIYAIELGGDEGGLKQVGSLAFILFVWWEIIPPLLVVIYFHRIPSPTSSPSSIHHTDSRSTQVADDDDAYNTFCCQSSLSRTTRVHPDDDGTDYTNMNSDPQVISSYAYSNYVTADDLDADLAAAAPSSPYTHTSLSMAFPTHTHHTPVNNNSGGLSNTTHLPYNYPPPPILSSAPRKSHTTSLPAKIAKTPPAIARTNMNGHSPPAPFATSPSMRTHQYQPQQPRERMILPLNRRESMEGTPLSDSDDDDSIKSI